MRTGGGSALISPCLGAAPLFEIALSDPQGKQEASVYYERVELPPHLPDSLFTLAPIAGAQEVDVDALAVE